MHRHPNVVTNPAPKIVAFDRKATPTRRENTAANISATRCAIVEALNIDEITAEFSDEC